MTDTKSALLATIVANPEDITPRLVYADLIEEEGDREMADLIRVERPNLTKRVIRRYREWIRSVVGPQFPKSSSSLWVFARNDLAREEFFESGYPCGGDKEMWAYVRHGFPEMFSVSGKHWKKFGPKMVRTLPLHRTNIRNVFPEDFHGYFARHVRWEDIPFCSTMLRAWYLRDRSDRDYDQIINVVWEHLTDDIDMKAVKLVSWNEWSYLPVKVYRDTKHAKIALSRACLAWARSQSLEGA